MLLLNITISTNWLIAIGILATIVIYVLRKAQKEKNQAEAKLRETSLQMKAKEAELKVSFQNWAITELEKFKQLEIDKIQKASDRQSRESAVVMLQKWKIEEEAKIRQDAINRSYSVNLGKITEHLIPFHHSFLSQFNPKDARFIGSPIDLIVFDGSADKKDEILIYLVEIKTGNSKLTEVQKRIKAAVLNGNIRWAEINPDSLIESSLPLSNDTIEAADPQEIENDKPDNIDRMIMLVIPKSGELKHQLIDRIADAIDSSITMAERDGLSVRDAIDRTFIEPDYTFRSDSDRITFINLLEMEI